MSFTEYSKIETLYERDPATFKVIPGRLKSRAYGLLKTWLWTEKVHGVNIGCTWRNGCVRFTGRTEQAEIHRDLLGWLHARVTAEKLSAVFPRLRADQQVVIYGEGCGAGIQKGGENYSSSKQMIVFDVLVDRFWLSYPNVLDVAGKLDLPVVPSFGEMSLEDATELVRRGFASRCAAKPRPAEGLVGRPLETLYDQHNRRLITKLKTRDF